MFQSKLANYIDCYDQLCLLLAHKSVMCESVMSYVERLNKEFNTLIEVLS